MNELARIHLRDPRKYIDVAWVVVLSDVAIEIPRKHRDDESDEHTNPEIHRRPKEDVVSPNVGPDERRSEGGVDTSVASNENRTDDNSSSDPPRPRSSVESVVEVGSVDSSDSHDGLKVELVNKEKRECKK